MPINNSPEQTRPHQVLDPCLLGRPVHLLPAFAATFADDLALLLAAPASRRYWGGFAVAQVEFARAPEGAALRWLGVAGPCGQASVAFERPLLVGLLEARYGGKGAAAPLRDPAGERVSATEERLGQTLSAQLAELLARCVRGMATRAGIELPAAAASAGGAGAPGKNAWAIAVTLREPHGGGSARCWIAPDQKMMGLILQALQPERPVLRAQRPADPLAANLKVKLEGRLVSHEITLEKLFALQVGEVIPVSVGRADVLLDESRLFTAAVAEHKGKLCLTSFEDAE
ncbi:MAG: FliM/FliN family flagellar motor switch protein [Pseudomonadota bacterium]